MTRPCLSCGALIDRGTRCRSCEGKRRASRTWYGDDWREVSRDAIAASPSCAECGATDDLTADHVIPRSRAGGLRVLCRSCNSRKGARRG